VLGEEEMIIETEIIDSLVLKLPIKTFGKKSRDI
jgi:hypothetical protein